VWLPACLPAYLPACLCIRTLPARVPQASFVGRRLLQDEDDTPTVTFPDDYPNSVRHFLLIGFLGMFIGAIVFFYMGISRKVNTVMHVLTFFVAAVSACAYYAEWAGLGVEYKTTDTTPRVIFWAHYLDWVVTGPLILADLALLSRSDTPTIISLVGNMVLYVICGLIGALTVAPYKYMWWVASLIFLIIVFMLLLQRLNNAEGYGGDALKGLTWLTILVWLVYPIVWIVGSEGTGALGLSQEVGIITIADLIAKIGFGFYLLANVDAPEAESAPLNQSSQQYV
jgi:bacteriorhodopsin